MCSSRPLLLLALLEVSGWLLRRGASPGLAVGVASFAGVSHSEGDFSRAVVLEGQRVCVACLEGGTLHSLRVFGAFV